MVTHRVAGASPYAERRQQVEEAARVMGRQLRDVNVEELTAAQGKMSREAFLRGRHVITDSARVPRGVALLKAGDAAGFGALMTEAHASFRDDFGASCVECDLLVRLALELEGCLGSRLTGGGFGGCTVSLVKAETAESFAAAIKAGYQKATGGVAQVFHHADEPSGIARVQADARLVEDEERVDQRCAEARREIHALDFAAAERARGAVEREVAETDFEQETETRAHFAEGRRRSPPRCMMCRALPP